MRTNKFASIRQYARLLAAYETIRLFRELDEVKLEVYANSSQENVERAIGAHEEQAEIRRNLKNSEFAYLLPYIS